MTEQGAPGGVDTSKPSPARMYDYYLGGKDNYEVDREAAEEISITIPEVARQARANRAFLQRTVRFLAGEAGIRQFIDIGSGLPTQGNVHEIAQHEAPGARVAYVDNDPIVLAHNRELLSGTDGTATVPGDMRRPDEILTHTQVDNLVDFDKPVAAVLVAVLHFVPDDKDPAGIVARFREAMAPGSYLVIAHATKEDRPPEAVARMAQVYAERSTAPFIFRTRDEILRLFDGFDLVDPGLVFAQKWRPDPDTPGEPGGEWNLAGVGRKP